MVTVVAPCTACLDNFQTTEEQREHYRSDRHTYNVKRRQTDLKPVSAELWAQKLENFARMEKKEKTKGTAHLKQKAPKSKPSSVVFVQDAVLTLKERTSSHCLFDEHKSSSWEENVTYMQSKYSFFIPHREYLVKPEELILYLHEKIYEGFTCLYCDKSFADETSCLRHMTDKNHTRIGTETYTRAGNFDEDGTQEMLLQLEPFYNFSSSFKELNPAAKKILEVTDNLKSIREEEELTDEEKVKRLFEYFDEDEDDLLNYEEAGNLYALSFGDDVEFAEEKYQQILGFLGTPEGISIEGLTKLYNSQIDTLADDFDKIDEWVDIAEDSDYDVKEYDNEEEYEKAIAKFGLTKAYITPTGDLKLPTGNVAAHRDFYYIYRQRGHRWTPEQRREKCQAIADGARRVPLMLGNGNSHGMCQIALSQRQKQNQGKQIIAILRRAQKSEKRRGEKQNVLQKRWTPRIRAQLGDAAGGR